MSAEPVEEQVVLVVRCEGPMPGSDLAPGDLFSGLGPEHWSAFERFDSIGEKVYIRTFAPTSWAPDPSYPVYRITLEREKAEGSS